MIRAIAIAGCLAVAAANAGASPPVIAADDEPTEPIEPAEARPPAHNKLGFRFGGGRLPLDGQPIGQIAFTLGVEHPALGRTRVFGEYEWMYISQAPEDPEAMPAQTGWVGSGHRTNLGLRRSFAAKRLGPIRFYADLEVGGGLGMYDLAAATQAVAIRPHGLVGIRGGYQIASRRSRGARLFETELAFRALVVEDGVGFVGGIGFYWGD